MTIFAASAEAQIVVEAGNAESLLRAIEQANVQNADSMSKRLFILVPNGIYDLGKRTLTAITGHQIALVGESIEGTIIVNAPDIENEGISQTATLLNFGHDTYVQDLTLKNALDYYHSGAAGRAVCWQDKGDRTMMKRVRMLSYQDTYYNNNERGRSYFEEAEIHGTIDFICGAGDVFFNHCLLVTEKRRAEGGGRDIIAAPRTSKTTWGYVFSHCTIRNDDSEFLYARGWRENPRCVWLYTKLETPEMLQSSRFEPKGMRTIQNDFYEYGTMDAEGRDITPKTNVVTFTLNDETHVVETILTEQQAAKYTLKNVFPHWQPQKIVRQLEKQGRRLQRQLLR
jgi:hypothetical protein